MHIDKYLIILHLQVCRKQMCDTRRCI